ncbi:AraC family transcriptional regulator [Aureispira anguillae]|uniref:AraC family transcriptional regulator n=1 Tax=Aureispira anguillae TaxID=2864201 RepID=A0A915YCV4_9BACT|nr:AraC family transcriptional regulator [Aureispira anguillae]BDS10757.1 AraC family transcriptional regulator [Aureispira anguillae]
MLLSDKLLKNRRLETLVENQTSFALQSAELHVFETHQEAEQVLLKFSQPILASMLEGKKVMHLNDMTAFDFLPGESLILPPNEMMCIDFPEAKMDRPTRCLAMAISEAKIMETVNFLNESRAKIDDEWKFTDYNFHFTNDIAIQQIVHRLLFLFTENHPSKDVFADFMLRELIIRILQTETKKIYTSKAMKLSSSHRLAFIIQYIRQNLEKNLTIKELSNKIYMSESNFHRVFKNELNISPIDFINNERIKLATSLLQDPKKKIKDVYMECGFNSLSYFIRVFKRKEQLSPKEYQLRANYKEGI